MLRRHDAERLLQADSGTQADNGTMDTPSAEQYATSYYYSSSGGSTTDVLASAADSHPMDTMGLLNALAGAFADVLSVNPFAIDPSQAKLTIAFCCVLMFLMIVGVWHFRKLEAHDREAFEMYVTSRKQVLGSEGEANILGKVIFLHSIRSYSPAYDV